MQPLSSAKGVSRGALVQHARMDLTASAKLFCLIGTTLFVALNHGERIAETEQDPRVDRSCRGEKMAPRGIEPLTVWCQSSRRFRPTHARCATGRVPALSALLCAARGDTYVGRTTQSINGSEAGEGPRNAHITIVSSSLVCSHRAGLDSAHLIKTPHLSRETSRLSAPSSQDVVIPEKVYPIAEA